MATPTFSAKLPDVTLQQLNELAAQFGVSKSQIVVQAVRQLHQQETQTMTTINRRNELINKIADLIVGHRLDDATVNATNEVGWNIDIRFKGAEYISENEWSRIEHVHLNPDELATAKRIAAELEATLN